MNYEAFMLALVIWREARGEGDEGMVAVGRVIANRVAHGWGDWIKVITAPAQFSSISIMGDPQTVKWPQVPDKAWERAQELANAFVGHSGEALAPDPTGGATFYWNPATATSGWFKHSVESGKLQKTVTINRHDFYREA